MPNNPQETIHQRRKRLWITIQRNPGLTEIDLTHRMGFTENQRRTVNNDLRALEDEGRIYKEGRCWFFLDFDNTRLRPFELSPEEAMTLYLATRLFVKQQDKRNEPAETALLQLAHVLTSDAGIGHEIEQAARELAQRQEKSGYQSIFRTIIRGYIYRKKVKISYRPLNGRSFDTTFATYLVEPSAIGFSTYIIGHSKSSYVDGIRSYKLERIEKAEMTRHEYVVPADFPGLNILRNAWSIISGEDTERIVLRFSPRVTERVLETQWHPSQDHRPDPDQPGYLRWWVDIADTTDMLPWIRSWGSDAEVLRPETLREQVTKTVVKLSQLYQTMATTKLPYQLPYAKTNPDNRDEIHLLLYHLIDVGQVTLVIWRDVLTDSIRQRLAQMLTLSIEQAGQFIAFLAALHDLGKAGPAYQKKYAPHWLKKELEEAGLGLLGLGKAYETSTPHGTVSTWALLELLPQMIGLDERFTRQIAVAVGGHHGSWPPPGAEDRIDDSKFPLWAEVRHDLVWEMQAVFQPPTAISPLSDFTERNIFLTIFSGLVSVADWLGSRNKECFGFVEQPMPTRQYATRSAQKARQSLADLGWLGWQPDGRTLSFIQAFAYLKDIKEPRGIQAEVIAAARDVPLPTLLILEAPTGIGKTETAVYLADCWLQQHRGRGLYVAMPTQATSNQMYGRIGDFLNYRYADSDKPINFHLVHGQAAWLDELKEKVELQRIGDDNLARVQAESWFTPRKRTLLAPFGVGTVDQTLMSILQTRHFFVRLFGLSHKVVIFDEVHAYDTFMSTLFQRLLRWLSAVGTSVIILSATLPAKTRQKLVEAYSGKTLLDTAAPYPCITIATPDSDPQIIPLTRPPDITLQLNWDISREPAGILAYLQQTMAHGGCAALICNTVGRAQEIYRALKNAHQDGTLDIAPDNLILFHARFPPVWRQEIEKTVLDKFGKERPECRPQKAIVVATQVIEQSLDLDFDLMITDLAPIDLIIQRAGRLHRHKRDERHGHGRSLLITHPRLDENGIPEFENDGYVYEPFVLLRSYLALQEQSEICIPGDTTDLIEAVYGESGLDKALSSTWQEAQQKTKQTMADNRHKAEFKAATQLVLDPGNRRLLKQRNENLDEESLEVHETFRAQTRDIDPGISLICLHQEDDSVYLTTRDGRIPVNLEEDVPLGLIRQYQQNMITLQHKGVFHHFVKQPVPRAWQQEATLRYCRPVIFQNSVYEMDSKYSLRLTQKFGLEIIKKEAA